MKLVIYSSTLSIISCEQHGQIKTNFSHTVCIQDLHVLNTNLSKYKNVVYCAGIMLFTRHQKFRPCYKHI